MSLKKGQKVKMTLNSSVPGRDSSEEKYGLFTNKKFGISWFALLFFLLVFLFNVSVIVPVILSLEVNKRMKNFKKLKSMDGPNYIRLNIISTISFKPYFSGFLSGHVHNRNNSCNFFIIRDDETFSNI